MKNYLKEEVQGESSCLGSIFKCFLFPCDSLDEFKSKLEQISKEHHKAKHIPYAYIINNEVRCSDDGEPSSTAGKPMLDFLTRNNMDDVGVIVTRYYGGKDLGVGRLRSYFLLSLEEAYKKASFITKEEAHYVIVSTPYDVFSSISRLAKSKHICIKDISYQMNVIFSIYAKKEEIYSLLSSFVDAYLLLEEGDKLIESRYLS